MHDDVELNHGALGEAHDHAEEEGPAMQARAAAHLRATSAGDWAGALMSGDLAAVRAALADRPGRVNQFLSQERLWGLEMWMPLHFASEAGHAAVVSELLSGGVRPECRTRFATPMHARRTPLHLAAAGGHVEVVALLLKAGADADVLDARSDRPLHLAARGGHAAAVVALLEAGADVDAKNGNGRSALHEAIRSAQGVADQAAHAAALALIGGGADVDSVCAKEPAARLPAMRCVAMGEGRAETLAALRERGARERWEQPEGVGDEP